MEQGRGLSVQRGKGVAKNGNTWIPLTPEKLVPSCSNNDQSGMQQNWMGGENWQNLLGMYEGVLRNEKARNLDLNINEGLNYGEHNQNGVPPAENYSRLQQNFTPSGIVGMKRKVKHSQDVAPVEVYNGLSLNSDPNGFSGANNLDHSIQNVGILHKLRVLSQNAGRIGSDAQNLEEFVSPESFSELMKIMEARRSQRSTLFSAEPTVTCPVPRIESNQVAYASVGERVQENHVFHGSNQVDYARVGAEFQQGHIFYEYRGGGYNQQDIPKSKPSTAKYTQNLTPRSETKECSSASRSSLLWPLTPDQQNQSKTHQILQVPHLLIEDTSTPKKHTNGSVFLPSESEIIEKEHGVTIENSIGTSTSGISTLPQDMKISDGVNGGIDLNKTPQQKTPKRAKHRPKVVVEGKPKRSPKPGSTKRNKPDGTPPAKRKYVRKDGTKNSTPPMTDTLNVVEASDTGPAIKSCRRKLNFDMQTREENKGEKEGLGAQPRQPDLQEKNNEGHKLSLDSSGPSASAAGAGHRNARDKVRRQTPTAYNFVDLTNNIPVESLPLETTALQPASREHNLNAIARNVHMRSASIHQSSGESRYNSVHHYSPGGHPGLVFQANPSEQNMEFREHSSVQTTAQVLEDLMDATYKQGRKREYKHTVIGSPKNITLMGSQLQSFGAMEWKNGSENFKKNIERKFHGTSINMHSGITNVETTRQTESRRNKILLAQSSTKPQNGESRNSVCRSINHYLNDNSTNVIFDPYMNYPNTGHKFQLHYASTQVHQCSEIMLPETFRNSGDTQITKSVTAVPNRNMDSASIRDPLPTAGLTTYKKAPTADKFLQQEAKNKRSYRNSSKKLTGIRVVDRNRVSVDDITDGMKYLHITNSSKGLDWKEQRAIVSYRADGAVVPYSVKKRVPRPKVDLDPETNRVWNLLMGNEGGESADKMDTHKEKWWEEERKVFRGRVDSFIARMHLVQGDRRFSKWKGSVVDSVIGVFLTQNVSDHLSSSAFMSLAAKFPPKSTTAGEPCCQDVRITYPDGTTFHQKMVSEPVKGHSSVTLAEKANHSTDNVLPQENTFQMKDHTRVTVEDIISSQSSSESFVLHVSDDVRSSSGSNSEADCWWNISKNVGHLSDSQQAKRVDTSEQNKSQKKENSCPNKKLIDHQTFETPAYVQSPGWADVSTVQHHHNSVLTFTNSCSNASLNMQNWKEDGLAFLGRESISTLTSKDSKGIGAQCMGDYRGQSAESAFVVSEVDRSKFETSSANHAVLEGGFELQNYSVDESCSSNGQHFHWGGTPLRDTKKLSDAFSKQLTDPCDIRKPTEVKTDIGHGQSSEKISSKISITTSIAGTRKAGKEKDERFEWDTLRKQAHLKSGTTERSREAMDSLDYEALYNADVHVISDTIKERGMNNKLAERMKNFLNRVVEDHEKIDLEWLRDVEPDKAKEYLLSIQGLGLKSVECVRLLTLHHLAFPVDTNVGRIAVRLGWVPLQPLPESLQLHLLELYPILESIQKYLWPRLCKLDQETLYELHYQMITFGKVFCTKRDPNCNACPMRGECRHFASAFASARLALPGPQEKHIVRSSAAPMRADNSSHVVIKPMPLLPSEDTVEPGVRLSKDCEPVIEEPKTPEPPIEVEERDIEDAFYEDPDEIPVIKLNIEEFATNVQSFIEGQIEIGGDMSRALVALNPGLPSIPTPKLKHISRLRTEHQVYELPDSHPLLKGMDRREPDDPSPYLLAIWTPGETADSVQAPESRCSYMERGGLCNNETCFSCNSAREVQAQTVRGTILIPCRTAMRGRFPLNGTYFQVNEVFADHESSLYPIDVPRSFLWNLPRRTVYFGSSVTSIFKGLTTEEIQLCFWKGFVCVRGFDQKTRAPRPLKARLHLPQSKMAKRNEEM